MLISLFRVVPFIAIHLFLVACSSGSNLIEPISPLTASATMPGAHLSTAETPPQGYEAFIAADQIYTLHNNGEDIWLHTRIEDLNKLAAASSLQAWLAAIDALRFPLDDGVLFWIPADSESDRLAFAERNKLTDAIAPDQLATLWRRRGDQLRTQGDYSDAINAYQHSISLTQTDPEPYAGLGASYMGRGRSEDAIILFQKALDLDPDHYWAHRLLGGVYLNLQRYALAADELTQAYILQPQDVHLLVGVALGQGRSGQSDQALRTLELLFARTDDPKLLADGELLRQEFSQNHQ